jgi:hypothetical protein
MPSRLSSTVVGQSISFLVDKAYAVVGFGGGTQWVPSLPTISFLVILAGYAGKYHEKRKFLGGLAALQTSPRETTAEVVS